MPLPSRRISGCHAGKIRQYRFLCTERRGGCGSSRRTRNAPRRSPGGGCSGSEVAGRYSNNRRASEIADVSRRFAQRGSVDQPAIAAEDHVAPREWADLPEEKAVVAVLSGRVFRGIVVRLLVTVVERDLTRDVVAGPQPAQETDIAAPQQIPLDRPLRAARPLMTVDRYRVGNVGLALEGQSRGRGGKIHADAQLHPA